jgi:hypothetical protein
VKRERFFLLASCCLHFIKIQRRFVSLGAAWIGVITCGTPAYVGHCEINQKVRVKITDIQATSNPAYLSGLTADQIFSLPP